MKKILFLALCSFLAFQPVAPADYELNPFTKKLDKTGLGGISYDGESDTLTVTAQNVKLRGWNERWEGSDGIGYVDFNDCPVAGCVSLGGKINFNGVNTLFLI